MSSEVKAKIYREMISELNARETPLRNERRRLEAAASRITEIDAALEVIKEERQEYVDALTPLEPQSVEATPKFDR